MIDSWLWPWTISALQSDFDSCWSKEGGTHISRIYEERVCEGGSCLPILSVPEQIRRRLLELLLLLLLLLPRLIVLTSVIRQWLIGWKNQLTVSEHWYKMNHPLEMIVRLLGFRCFPYQKAIYSIGVIYLRWVNRDITFRILSLVGTNIHSISVRWDSRRWEIYLRRWFWVLWTILNTGIVDVVVEVIDVEASIVRKWISLHGRFTYSCDCWLWCWQSAVVWSSSASNCSKLRL